MVDVATHKDKCIGGCACEGGDVAYGVLRSVLAQ